MLRYNRRSFLRHAVSLSVGAKALLEGKAHAADAPPVVPPPAAADAPPAAVKAHADPSPEAWNELPIRALLMWAPAREDLPLYCRFIREALPREGVNTLVAMFNYGYQFQSHPELAERGALSRDEVRQIVRACRDAGVTLIPEMNLMAHQSEGEQILPLLAKYPQFDESPDLKPPHPWRPGGEFDFYSKSLCPRHPGLFKVIFPIMDELIDACEAGAFHVGLDEVWIIAHDRCPRCGGSDPAQIFAEYVTRLHAHLVEKNCRMWMWSDRLIDGVTTGLLAWQASKNNTYRAIDMIPKDIMICDWKYEDAPPTPAYFAVKGFDVLPSSCYNADAALAQLEQVSLARRNAARASFSPVLASRMPGVFSTTWMNAREFIQAYYAAEGVTHSQLSKDTASTFKRLFAEIRKNRTI
jgi:hypothetical protein